MTGSDNRTKIPLASSLNQLSGQRSSDAAQSMAKGIPAQIVSRDGQMVTVAFQMQVGGAGGPWTLVQATYPIATSSLDWHPLNKGTNGLLLPSDFHTGGVSGAGGGTADFSQRGNLASLQFHPISHKTWTPPGGDTDKRAIQGPNGVYMQDTGGAIKFTMDKSTGLVIEFNGHKIEIKSDGVYIEGRKFLTHQHTGVTTGSGNTGGIV